MDGSFLQSREWEEFQRSLGRKTWRAEDILLIRHDAALGMNYLYCPRPDSGLWNLESGIWNEAREIARREKSIFLKIDPIGDIFFPTSGIQHPASSLQPQKTIILNLQKSEDELLAAMHEKTRYNIRLAERKGVRITRYETNITRHETEIFWRLLRETARRDGFHTHQKEYYEKMLVMRSAALSNELFFAQYRGEVLAAAMVNFYRPVSSFQPSSDQSATYLHGASSGRHREIMAPHLLHWRIMQEARSRGYLRYDFWGIDEVRWPGLTRFKRGFGGTLASYPVSVDVAYRSAWYGAYRMKRFLASWRV